VRKRIWAGYDLLMKQYGGKKIIVGDHFKAFFLIKVGQNWVIKGGHFSVVNSMQSRKL
jgi:hypothetical protein